MKNFLDNRMTTAIVSILLLGIGLISISILGTTHLAKADQKGELCVLFACGNANITRSTSTGGGGGAGGSITAKLIVTKEVVCSANAACPQPESFTIKVTGNSPSPSTIHDDGTGTQVTIGPGEFAVTEAPTNGFTISFSGECDGKITAGETKNCKVINTLNPNTGTLIVKKVITNCPDPCQFEPSDFTMKVIGNNPSLSSFPGSETGTEVTVDPGNFAIEEIQPAGFNGGVFPTEGCGGGGTIAAGETKTCVMENRLGGP